MARFQLDVEYYETKYQVATVVVEAEDEKSAVKAAEAMSLDAFDCDGTDYDSDGPKVIGVTPTESSADFVVRDGSLVSPE